MHHNIFQKLASEATLSQAFAEFVEDKLDERAHETLTKAMMGEQLIDHLSRDGNAIEARERSVESKHSTTEPAVDTTP